MDIGTQMGNYVENRIAASVLQAVPADRRVTLTAADLSDPRALYNALNSFLGEHGSLHQDPVYLIGASPGLTAALRAPISGHDSALRLIEHAWGPCRWLPQQVKGAEDSLLAFQASSTKFWIEATETYHEPIIQGPKVPGHINNVAFQVEAAAGLEEIVLGIIPLEGTLTVSG